MSMAGLSMRIGPSVGQASDKAAEVDFIDRRSPAPDNAAASQNPEFHLSRQG